MQYVCDAPDGTVWFRLETDLEAAAESAAMQHAVEKHFCAARDKARAGFQPAAIAFFEQEIGLKAHLAREMPLFLSLRDENGRSLATAMLPPGGVPLAGFRCIIVGSQNADPYPARAEAIAALGRHFGMKLERSDCYPYRH